MRLPEVLAFAAVSVSLGLCSGQRPTSAAPALQGAGDSQQVQAPGRFTSADRTFHFDYPKVLLPCTATKASNQDANTVWEPAQSCEAYFPMCDAQNLEGGEKTACLAYPKKLMKEYPEFEAATFSVAVASRTTAENCLTLPGDWLKFDPRRDMGSVFIRGASFREFDVSEGGMGQYVHRQIYRHFRMGTCYELSVSIAAITQGTVDLVPPMKPFGDKEMQHIRRQLLLSLNSFQLLK